MSSTFSAAKLSTNSEPEHDREGQGLSRADCGARLIEALATEAKYPSQDKAVEQNLYLNHLRVRRTLSVPPAAQPRAYADEV